MPSRENLTRNSGYSADEVGIRRLNNSKIFDRIKQSLLLNPNSDAPEPSKIRIISLRTKEGRYNEVRDEHRIKTTMGVQFNVGDKTFVRNFNVVKDKSLGVGSPL